MSYRLNRTDGSLLVDLIDGEIDQDSTDITLVGRNYEGYGEFFNENFIAILENFANSSAPTNPLTGQLWFDTAAGRIKVFDGAGFTSSGAPQVDNNFPNNPVAGDLFINNQDKQLFFFDGTTWTLSGPIYKAGQGNTGLEVDNLLDTQGRSRIILKKFIQGTLVGIYSNIEFTPAQGFGIGGIIPPIQVGFTPVNNNFRYNGTATNSLNLVTEAGIPRNADSFLPADANGVTIGTLTIQNSGGLTIGSAQNNVQKVVGQSFVTENGLLNHDYKIRVRSEKFGGLLVDAVTVDTENARVGIFQGSPQYSLDVTGDLRVTGNMLVEGDTTNIDVTTLRVQDKNIELAITDNGTLQTDTAVDGAGVIVKATGDDKSFVWRNSTNAWTSSPNIDLKVGQAYHINSNQVLSETALGTVVTDALGLERIGTLQYLDVDNININSTTITTTSTGLNIISADTISVNNQRITGVLNPTINNDVATKEYVDTQLDSERVVLSLDVSNLTNSDIANIIESLHPASEKENGTEARIATTTIVGSSVIGIDVNSVSNKTFQAVDSDGTKNVSVLKDITFNSASGTVAVTITRGLKQFIVDNGVWIFVQDLPTGL